MLVTGAFGQYLIIPATVVGKADPFASPLCLFAPTAFFICRHWPAAAAGRQG